MKKNNNNVEAGKRGGAATRAKYGPEHFRELGRRGGAATKAKRPDHFRAAGRKGGAETLARHGAKHYQEIGTKGGAAVRDLIDRGRAAARVERAKLVNAPVPPPAAIHYDMEGNRVGQVVPGQAVTPLPPTDKPESA